MNRYLLLIILFLLISVVSIFYAQRPSLDPLDYYKVRAFSETFKPEEDTLILMTFNIGYLSGMTNNLPQERPESLILENLCNTVALIERLNPDIIGFQEIDFGSRRSYFTQQLDSLAIALKFSSGYQSVNWDKNYVPFPYWPLYANFGKVLSGQALLSRFPIVSASTATLIKPQNVPFYYNLFYLDRLVQVADIQVGDALWKVMNVHLEAFDEPTRTAQAYTVKELFEQYSAEGPVILMGDFNSRPEYESALSEAMKVLIQAENIRSAISEEVYRSDSSKCFTFNTRAPYQMIDYIFYNDNFVECTEVRVLHEAGEISDHFPVTGKFKLRGRPE